MKTQLFVWLTLSGAAILIQPGVASLYASQPQLPVSNYTCPAASGNTYGQGAVLQKDTDDPVRPAWNHADKNLALRSYSLVSQALTLVNLGSDDPTQPPQFATLFNPDRTPTFSAAYAANNWNWQPSPNPGAQGSPIQTPPVTVLGLRTTPGEILQAPTSGYNIGSPFGAGGSMVMFADADSVTLKYGREDSAATGYTVHIDNICTDPNLLLLYNQLDNLARNTYYGTPDNNTDYNLPGLSAGQVFGTARGTEVRVAIVDTGSFQDPRSQFEWWQIRGNAVGKAPVDFYGDGKSDIVVYRGGAWLFHNFDTGLYTEGIWTGAPGSCIPAPMDYDGDGGVEPTMLCDGAWHFFNDNGTYNKGIWTGGVPGDRPVPADYDGDGDDDVVVFRGGAWMFYDFASGAYTGGVWTGAPGTLTPAPMDYDGDGTADFTVYAGGPWHFFNDNGTYNKGIWTGGVPGDRPAPADYNGDGTEEVVVFRGGAWLFHDFASGAYTGGVWTGAPGTILPAPLDYDGDGAADFTVYGGGPWHFFNDNGTYNKGIWTGGVAGDQAISRRLLP